MKGRAEILVGRNSVREALRAKRRRVERVSLADGISEKGIIEEILRLCLEAGVPVSRVKRRSLANEVKPDCLGDRLKHQGVIARVSPYPYVGLSAILSLASQRGEAPLLLALDCLQDPQNVGSLMRSAEAVGVHGVILPARRSVGITPAVSRSSAGAAEHLRVTVVTNLARTLEGLKSTGLWIVGVEACSSSQDYRFVDLNMPLVLVLGSEGRGIRRLILDKCDLVLRIPMTGHIGSLNVSVAGSILLYQAWNARRGQA